MERKVILWEQKINAPFPQGVKMRIALCDWDKNFVKKIKNIIYTYAEHFRMEILVDCYHSGEALLNSLVNYNLIFLGYKLEGINGLKTAKLIRNKNPYISIVFVSEYTDFVFDSFKVNPYRFLVKPISQNMIYETLNDFFEKFGKDYCLWVKYRDDTVCLNTGEIYYLEANNKHCIIHLEDQILNCNKTMAKVFGSLPENHFSKINRAFVVNLNFIKKHNNKEIQLTNKQSLTIGRNYLKTFKEEYRLFSQPIEL